jgi:hypothetical protein
VVNPAAVAVVLVSAALGFGFEPPSAAATGSGGAQGGRPRENAAQAEPKTRHPDDAPPRAADQPGRLPLSRETLEERLRQGQADQPVAQGQISERLEQFYRGSPEQPASKESGR